MRKRCDKGKSCGSSCIQSSKACTATLSPRVSSTVRKVQEKLGVVALFKRVQERGVRGDRAIFERLRAQLKKELGHNIISQEDIAELKSRLVKAGLLSPSLPTEDVKEWDWLKAGDYDKKIEKKPMKRIGSESYNGWADSSKPTAKEAGLGSFASVISNPNGEYVKRGVVTENEVRILEKVGRKDLGPGLIAADLDGKIKTEGHEDLESVKHLGLRQGRIAMTRVPGKDLDLLGSLPEDQIAGKKAADVYWQAMAELHRLGIAHNDAHPGNLKIGDKTGKGRWVDFGLSQDNPKAALAEALGSLEIPKSLKNANPWKHVPDDASGHITAGNWQSLDWPVTGLVSSSRLLRDGKEKELGNEFPALGRMYKNLNPVVNTLRKKHNMEPEEVVAMMVHGIRSPIETYEQGPWKKLSDDDAQGLINALYKGV